MTAPSEQPADSNSDAGIPLRAAVAVTIAAIYLFIYGNLMVVAAVEIFGFNGNVLTDIVGFLFLLAAFALLFNAMIAVIFAPTGQRSAQWMLMLSAVPIVWWTWAQVEAMQHPDWGFAALAMSFTVPLLLAGLLVRSAFPAAVTAKTLDSREVPP